MSSWELARESFVKLRAGEREFRQAESWLERVLSSWELARESLVKLGAG